MNGTKVKKEMAWPRGQRGGLKALCSGGSVLISTVLKRFVWLEVGSAHTSIAFHMQTGPRLSHGEANNVAVDVRAKKVREKVCAGDKSLTGPEHPTETPLSHPLGLFLLQGMTAIRHSNQHVFSGNDFTVNRPAQGKPLLAHFSGKGHDAHFLPCFVSRSTFHLFKEAILSSSARFPQVFLLNICRSWSSVSIFLAIGCNYWRRSLRNSVMWQPDTSSMHSTTLQRTAYNTITQRTQGLRFPSTVSGSGLVLNA